MTVPHVTRAALADAVFHHVEMMVRGKPWPGWKPVCDAVVDVVLTNEAVGVAVAAAGALHKIGDWQLDQAIEKWDALLAVLPDDHDPLIDWYHGWFQMVRDLIDGVYGHGAADDTTVPAARHLPGSHGDESETRQDERDRKPV